MSAATVESPPRVAKRRRTKDGCRPCRVRKKKCDGRKPTCVSCERNVLLCSWFPGTTGGTTGERGSKDTECRLRNSDAAEQRSNDEKRRRKASLALSSQSSLSSSSSAAAAAAAARSESVDGTLFANCSNRPPFLAGAEVQSTTALRHRPLLEPTFRSPTSVLLYQHWIERTADVMAAKRGHRNAFVTELPRLAVAYPDTVLQSVLAISGIHYCNGNKLPEVETTTWTHLGLALRSLKYGLTKLMSSEEGYDPVPLLTTSLVMCFLENTRGDVNGSVSHHVKAAHILFNAALVSHSLQMDESILEFLKEFYIYITRITDISYDSERPPSEVGADPTGAKNSVVSWIGAKSHGMLVGCAYEIFNLIPRVSALARRKRGRLRNRDSGKQMTEDQVRELEEDWASYRAMHAYIESWEPPSDADAEIVTCGAIYQQAVLCYLDVSFADPSLVSGSQLPPFVQERFDALNQLLQALSLDANISSTLCWPLALFGSLAKDEAQRDIIYQRLQAMWDALKIGNITSTLKFLERIWGDLRKGEIVLVGSSSPSTTSGSKGRKSTPVDLTDMEGLMKRYNFLVSFV